MAASACKTVERSLLGYVPPADAVGIGGSRGRGEGDRWSDSDFFVFFDSGDIFAHTHALRSFLLGAQGGQMLEIGSVKMVEGFGVGFSCIDRSARVCDVFANTPSSWTANEMRRHTTVLADRTGRFSRLVAGIPEDDTPDLLLDLAIQHWKGVKWLNRRDGHELRYRLAKTVRLTRSLLVGLGADLQVDAGTPGDLHGYLAAFAELKRAVDVVLESDPALHARWTRLMAAIDRAQAR